jgi:hypothetical protein
LCEQVAASVRRVVLLSLGLLTLPAQADNPRTMNTAIPARISFSSWRPNHWVTATRDCDADRFSFKKFNDHL